VQFEDLVRNIIENECEDYYLGVADLSTVENSLFKNMVCYLMNISGPFP
jgi:hypothetical protein